MKVAKKKYAKKLYICYNKNCKYLVRQIYEIIWLGDNSTNNNILLDNWIVCNNTQKESVNYYLSDTIKFSN